MREPQWMRERRLGKEASNPFRRRRKANQADRFATKSEAAKHPSLREGVR